MCQTGLANVSTEPIRKMTPSEAGAYRPPSARVSNGVAWGPRFIGKFVDNLPTYA